MSKQKRPTRDRTKRLWIMCLAKDAPDPPYLLIINRFPGQALAELAAVNGWSHTTLKTRGHKIGVMYDGELTRERLSAGLDKFTEYVTSATLDLRDQIESSIAEARECSS